MSEEKEVAEVAATTPDTQVRRELSVTRMTLHRWDRDPRMRAIGWPARLRVGSRNHRDTEAYKKFKAKMAREAIARRDALLKSQTEEPSEQTA
jgi:hypothetical protein